MYRNVVRPVWKTCGMDFSVGISLRIIGALLTFLTPKLMGLLIEFVENKQIESWKGYLYAALLLLIYVATTGT